MPKKNSSKLRSLRVGSGFPVIRHDGALQLHGKFGGPVLPLKTRSGLNTELQLDRRKIDLFVTWGMDDEARYRRDRVATGIARVEKQNGQPVALHVGDGVKWPLILMDAHEEQPRQILVEAQLLDGPELD